MDQDLLRAALLARARRHRNRRRARLAALVLVVLAVAGIGRQLALADVPLSFLARWWPAVAAGLALVAAGLLWTRARPAPAPLSGEGRWSRIGGMVTTVTALGALVFTAISLQATRDQIDVAREGQLTDRFTHAIDQLGTEGPENLPRRVGGIYALERIAVDSPRDQATMVEVLSAFLRTDGPRAGGKPCGPTPADVSAAFTVLTRRDVGRDPVTMEIDLRGLCLRDVQVEFGDLTGMSLNGSDLTGANLSMARFWQTSMSEAILVDVDLLGVDMTDGFVSAGHADFSGADLSFTELGSTDFSGSVFVGADLRGSDLGSADFTGTDLSDALHDDRTRATGAKRAGATGAWW